jgi:hypothetical protein
MTARPRGKGGSRPVAFSEFLKYGRRSERSLTAIAHRSDVQRATDRRLEAFYLACSTRFVMSRPVEPASTQPRNPSARGIDTVPSQSTTVTASVRCTPVATKNRANTLTALPFVGRAIDGPRLRRYIRMPNRARRAHIHDATAIRFSHIHRSRTSVLTDPSTAHARPIGRGNSFFLKYPNRCDMCAECTGMDTAVQGRDLIMTDERQSMRTTQCVTT